MTTLTQHRTKIIGWKRHASKDSIEIPDGESEYYEFGKRTKGSGNFPSKNYNIHSIYSGSRDPKHNISNIEPVAGVGFQPTNGLEFYYAFGNVVNGGAASPDSDHAVVGIDQGALPSRVIRYESGHATENIREEAINAKTKALNFQVFDVNRNIPSPVNIGVGFQATDIRIASYSGGSLSPIFPSSKEEMYFADKSNFVFEWDAGGTPVDYKDVLMNFQYICDMTSRFQPLVEQMMPNAILDGVRTHVLVFDMLRGDDISIYTDHQAQDRSHTPKDIRIKCYAKGSTTEYMQLYFNDVYTSKVDMNNGDVGKDELDTYKVVAVASSVMPTIRDGVADGFYTEV